MRYVLPMTFICSISLPRLPSSVQEQILEQNLKKTIEPRGFVTGRQPGLSPEIRLAIGHMLLRTGKALQCGSCYSSPSLQSTPVKARASFLDSSETLPGISWVWSHLTRPPSEHPLPLSGFARNLGFLLGRSLHRPGGSRSGLSHGGGAAVSKLSEDDSQFSRAQTEHSCQRGDSARTNMFPDNVLT